MRARLVDRSSNEVSRSGKWRGKLKILKSLMCVLASVRNFFVVCFLRVRSNSVCGSLSVRSGLDHLLNMSEDSREARATGDDPSAK